MATSDRGHATRHIWDLRVSTDPGFLDGPVGFDNPRARLQVAAAPDPQRGYVAREQAKQVANICTSSVHLSENSLGGPSQRTGVSITANLYRTILKTIAFHRSRTTAPNKKAGPIHRSGDVKKERSRLWREEHRYRERKNRRLEEGF